MIVSSSSVKSIQTSCSCALPVNLDIRQCTAGGLKGRHDAAIQQLLVAGADINANGGYYGNAPQAALAGGHDAIVQGLFKAGADVNAQEGTYGNGLQAVEMVMAGRFLH